MSKQNTIAKMIHLINKMEIDGLWLTYKRVDEVTTNRGLSNRTAAKSVVRHVPNPSDQVKFCI